MTQATTTRHGPTHLDGLSDGALLGRVARQDVAAFGVFYDRHIGAAMALSRRSVGGRQPADDVCQEAFLAVWRSAWRFDADRGEARPWVLTIVRNRAIDHLRRTRRAGDHEVLGDAIAERQPARWEEGTERVALRTLQADELRGRLSALDDDQRRVIELAFYDGLTHVEIAARLGLPLGTVKARVQRGLAKLRGTPGVIAPTRRPASDRSPTAVPAGG